ncbi:DMT family transporter [Cohnella ginsengisoli]|uniref:DMT family transporter n=1 Tax=Cohnella ginsengisoli TaxID=425004 RepID=A0A9X4KFP3_9BACL|nr:DMT family transporter [Cohnella ginsengisoli]MDG0791262.1 DMT family transporter [Cohnella ginsengisoli]
MFVWQLVLTSLLWAGNFVAGKWTAGHASAMMLSELRFGIAILVILPFVWMKEKRLFPPRKAILLLLGMGATGVTLFNVLLFEALAHTSAANTGLLSTLNPAAIALISFLAFGHRLTLRQAVGMIVSFAGVVIVLTRGGIGAAARPPIQSRRPDDDRRRAVLGLLHHPVPKKRWPT